MTILAPELVAHLRANPQVRVALSAFSHAFVQAFFRDGLSQEVAMVIAEQAWHVAVAEQRATREKEQLNGATGRLAS